jgi:hypothetical protein
VTLAGRTILTVLGVWHGLAAVQNVFDVLATTGVAPRLRPVASKNFELVAKLARPLHPNVRTIATLLAGASLVEAAAAVSFARGALAGACDDAGFGLSLALFGSFFLIDDAFDDYDLGAKHRAIFTLVAISYVAAKAAEA